MSAEFSKKDFVNKKTTYVLGALFGVLATVVSMFIFAAVLLLLNIDRTYAIPFATISLAVGCFIASRYTARKIGDKGYLIGLIIGMTVFVIITILSLVLGNSISINTLFHFIIIMLSSLVGGITGVNKDRHKKLI